MTKDEVNQQKEIEYYAANVTAWYNTALERDKGLFTLSAGGIGLLTTLLTTVGPLSVLVIHFYYAALVCFGVSLIAVLLIYDRNKTHIEQVISSKAEMSDRVLGILDKTALFAFGLGAVFSVVIGISSTIASPHTKEKILATIIVKDSTSIKDDLSGPRESLRPPLTKSFNESGKLRPTPAAETPEAVPPANAPTAPTTSSVPPPGQGAGK